MKTQCKRVKSVTIARRSLSFDLTRCSRLDVPRISRGRKGDSAPNGLLAKQVSQVLAVREREGALFAAQSFFRRF